MRQSLPHGGGGMVRQSWYPCQCAEPNTYEASFCQETHYPLERVFAFFPRSRAWRSRQSVSCPDLISMHGCDQ